MWVWNAWFFYLLFSAGIKKPNIDIWPVFPFKVFIIFARSLDLQLSHFAIASLIFLRISSWSANFDLSTNVSSLGASYHVFTCWCNRGCWSLYQSFLDPNNVWRQLDQRTLGGYLIPYGRSTAQYNILIRQSKSWGVMIAGINVFARHMLDQFTQKPLRIAMILVLRRQKPLTNALDGLYLPYVDCMLEARWVEGSAVSLSRGTCVWWKSCWGPPFTHDGVGFHHMGRWHYIGCLYQGVTILNPWPLPSALRINLQGDGLHVHDDYDLSS